jgi:hypothetical protein
MANLLWKTKNSTRKLLSTPFQSEEEFEKFVFETPEILEDIYLLKRQVRGGKKPGIPDIIGIDDDANVCIIEMKNTKVDYSIIPQVLQYAIWADKNPDSIKALWLEADDKPEELEISWDNLTVRIIVIAPEILPSTVQYIDKISYTVDLIEINRWAEKNNHIALVKKLEPEKQSPKIRPVRGLENYNEEFYKSYHNKESVKAFYKYISELDKIIKQKGWSLEKKFNKFYCAYKAGFFTAFRVHWITTKTFAFSFNLSITESKRLNLKGNKGKERRGTLYFYIDPDKTKTTSFLPIFELAYKKLTGE